MSTEQRLSEARARISKAQQEETRNTILRERALKERDEALASLKDEFNVFSLDEAKLLRKKLEADVETDLQKLEAALDALEA